MIRFPRYPQAFVAGSPPLKLRNLHTLHRLATNQNGHPPLVFVHGGYVHAGCWDLHFLPYFRDLGYKVTPSIFRDMAPAPGAKTSTAMTSITMRPTWRKWWRSCPACRY